MPGCLLGRHYLPLSRTVVFLCQHKCRLETETFFSSFYTVSHKKPATRYLFITLINVGLLAHLAILRLIVLCKSVLLLLNVILYFIIIFCSWYWTLSVSEKKLIFYDCCYCRPAWPALRARYAMVAVVGPSVRPYVVRPLSVPWSYLEN